MASEPMNLTRVESSMVYAVGYDPDSQAMDVVFSQRPDYRYLGMPQEVYQGLMAAGV